MKKRKKQIVTAGLAVLLCLFILTGLKILKPDHEFYCDKFRLTVDDRQLDLKEYDTELSSVSELLLIDPDHLFIMGRVSDTENALMIYDFKNEEIMFNERGTAMCWTDDDYRSCRYQVGDAVYSLTGDKVYEAPRDQHIYMIEYVEKYFKITLSDLQYENLKEVWM